MVMNFATFDTNLHMIHHYRRVNSAKSVVNTSPPKYYKQHRNVSSVNSRYSTPSLLSKTERIPSRTNSHCEVRRRKIHNCLQNELITAGRSSSVPPRPSTRRNPKTLPQNYIKASDPYPKLRNDESKKIPIKIDRTNASPKHDIISRNENIPQPVLKSKVNTGKKPVPAPRLLLSNKKNIIPDYEYLQFSLRITEDIIRNDLYSSREMERVFNSHVEANRGRLSMTKMLQQIDHLCKELNIAKKVSRDKNVCFCKRKKLSTNSNNTLLQGSKEILLNQIINKHYEMTDDDIQELTEKDLQDVITGILDSDNFDLCSLCVEEMALASTVNNEKSVEQILKTSSEKLMIQNMSNSEISKESNINEIHNNMVYTTENKNSDNQRVKYDEESKITGISDESKITQNASEENISIDKNVSEIQQKIDYIPENMKNDNISDEIYNPIENVDNKTISENLEILQSEKSISKENSVVETQNKTEYIPDNMSTSDLLKNSIESETISKIHQDEIVPQPDSNHSKKDNYGSHESDNISLEFINKSDISVESEIELQGNVILICKRNNDAVPSDNAMMELLQSNLGNSSNLTLESDSAKENGNNLIPKTSTNQGIEQAEKSISKVDQEMIKENEVSIINKSIIDSIIHSMNSVSKSSKLSSDKITQTTYTAEINPKQDNETNISIHNDADSLPISHLSNQTVEDKISECKIKENIIPEQKLLESEEKQDSFVTTVNNMIMDKMQYLFEVPERKCSSNNSGINDNFIKADYYKYEKKNSDDKYICDKYKNQHYTDNNSEKNVHKNTKKCSCKTSEISLSEGEIIASSRDSGLFRIESNKLAKKSEQHILEHLKKYEQKTPNSTDIKNINQSIGAYELNIFEEHCVNYIPKIRRSFFYPSVCTQTSFGSGLNKNSKSKLHQEQLLSDGEVRYSSSESDDTRTDTSDDRNIFNGKRY